MAKAILVVDMPNDCSECEYLRRMQYGQYCILCDVTPRINNRRPSWCPLKPMPEKTIPFPVDDEEQKQFCKGWNACIDAICGKEG